MSAIAGREFADYGDDRGSLRQHMAEAEWRTDMDALERRFSGDVECVAAEIGDLSERLGDGGMTPHEIAETMEEWVIAALADWFAPRAQRPGVSLTWSELLQAIKAQAEAEQAQRVGT